MDRRKRLRIDGSNPTPVYAQIETQLERLIFSGAYGPGERIPSVRELAIALEVNPLTVSKAYARLSERGVVETVRGKGVFVAERKAALTEKRRERILEDAIDRLVAEARQLGVPLERLAEMVRERGEEAV